MNDQFKIDEGKTYEYVVHGSVIFLVGIILLSVHWSLTLLFTIAAIGLFSIQTGVEINYETNSIRKYTVFLGIKVGTWYNLTNFQAAELRYNSQRIGYEKVYWSSYFSPKPRSTDTYDLLLIDKYGKPLLLNPFLKFSMGNKTMEALKKINGLANRNFAAERLANQKKSL